VKTLGRGGGRTACGGGHKVPRMLEHPPRRSLCICTACRATVLCTGACSAAVVAGLGPVRVAQSSSHFCRHQCGLAPLVASSSSSQRRRDCCASLVLVWCTHRCPPVLASAVHLCTPCCLWHRCSAPGPWRRVAHYHWRALRLGVLRSPCTRACIIFDQFSAANLSAPPRHAWSESVLGRRNLGGGRTCPRYLAFSLWCRPAGPAH
jgi:hypothetical protein